MINGPGGNFYAALLRAAPGGVGGGFVFGRAINFGVRACPQ